MKTDIHQEITNSIIEQLENGVKPWVCPWKESSNPFPINFQTKANYTGINILSLYCSAIRNNYTSPYWLTFNQARKIGGHVRRDEKSTLGVFYKNITVEDNSGNYENNEKNIPILNSFRVFNLDQIDGIELPTDEELNENPINFDEDELFNRAESLVKNIGVPVLYKGDKAFYSPSRDEITMPEKNRFNNTFDLISTLGHEAGHSTGAKKRLNREFGKRFGDNAYALEELVAEISSVLINSHLGVEGVHVDHVSYINDWLDVMKADKTAIFSASKHAFAAYEYITNPQTH